MHDRVTDQPLAPRRQLFVTRPTLFRYQQIKYEIDPEYLFSPISGEGKLERRIVENYFKVNYTHRFNVGRITRPGEISLIVFDRHVD